MKTRQDKTRQDKTRLKFSTKKYTSAYILNISASCAAKIFFTKIIVLEKYNV